MSRPYAGFFIIALLVFAACSRQDLLVHDAWIRAAPDGSALGVAYLTLVNNGPDTEIVSVRSEAHEFASLHISELADGVVRMRELKRIPVKQDTIVRFEPGALHIMLMQARSSLREGDIVELVLEFDDGQMIAFEAPVSKESR